MIIDDEMALAEGLVEAVTAAGFAADTAFDGPSGLELGLANDYDAVILDLGLPGMTGLEVLRTWRAERRTMPVIILSARGE